MSTNDGGPRDPYPNCDNEQYPSRVTGMTLRDYFAGQALAALVQIAPDPDEKVKQSAIGTWAYQLADAMIKAREEGK